MSRLKCTLILFVIGTVLNEKIIYKGYQTITLTGKIDALEKVKNYFEHVEEIIFLSAIKTKYNYLVSPVYVEKFKAEVLINNLKFNVVNEDFSKIAEREIKLQRREGFSWDAYYDVDGIYKYLEATAQNYPNSTKLVKGGETYEKREILGLRIMTPYEEAEEKPAIFIESGIHAREWITPATITFFINELLTSDDPDVIRLRRKFDWHIFPTVNPDGYHYSHTTDRFWRKTRSRSSDECFGTDGNRNWDYNWGGVGTSHDPCNYQLYAGSQAFSEIETKSLSEYIGDIINLQAYVSFHSDGQMLLMPYSDSVDHHDNYDDLMKIGLTSLEYGRKVNGVEYHGIGTAAEILYKVTGGSMDWVKQALGTPIVFTYELRSDNLPFHWPPDRIPEQGNEVTQMLLGMIVEAENLHYF